MTFETLKQAVDYANDQTSITRRKHKAVKCKGWFFDRSTGEYHLQECFTVVLFG